MSSSQAQMVLRQHSAAHDKAIYEGPRSFWAMLREWGDPVKLGRQPRRSIETSGGVRLWFCRCKHSPEIGPKP